jgi:type II secretory pathway predicted ATPase ExeA
MTLSAQRRVIGELRTHLFARFGLRENPFGVTPNPKYLYESHTHREAKSSLIIGVECGVGFQALIAPPGMGKTTILSRQIHRSR